MNDTLPVNETVGRVALLIAPGGVRSIGFP
ncbi:hypothetical protein GGR88_000334 [Sphingomonas jejuensis]|uniref:Uncharacterized protein n=1 Tax=Sphingomonas jejuensis TaxID=904715 RepID=A0ABX0XI01_9SPHN|nr:hypothetical protein [Sphingomonas jejuensis]